MTADCRYRAVLATANGFRTARPISYPTAGQAAAYIDRTVRGPSRWADGWVEQRGGDGRWRRLDSRGKLRTENT